MDRHVATPGVAITVAQHCEMDAGNSLSALTAALGWTQTDETQTDVSYPGGGVLPVSLSGVILLQAG